MAAPDKGYTSEARYQLDETVAEWTKRGKELDDLGKFLNLAGHSYKKQVMVPIGTGNLAFMPGEIYHMGEVMVSLGMNWFAETNLQNAKRIQNDRRQYVTDQLNRSKAVYDELDVKEKMAGEQSTRIVDKDGDELNEEGLKYVDIQEPYVSDDLETSVAAVHTTKKPSSRSNAKVERHVQFADAEEEDEEDYEGNGLEKHELEDFDKNLLEKLRLMELQEDSDEKSGKTDQGLQTSSKSRTDAQHRQPPHPVKSEVFERGFGEERASDGDSDDESDFDNMILGQQVSIEYDRKRAQFLAANLLQPAKGLCDEEGNLNQQYQDAIAEMPSSRPAAPPIVEPSHLSAKMSVATRERMHAFTHQSEVTSLQAPEPVPEPVPVPAPVPAASAQTPKPKLSYFKQQALNRRQRHQ
ncbi:hypothetical protein BASA62_006907 [Batrachochytrium salamandrivorans]|nr:hypothetical protein BASA62_006907 [Batrachochytrium salamandrivorans]